MPYLANVPIWIHQLNAELQLMSDLDTLRIRILQTPCQSFREVQITRELIALCRFINNFQGIIMIQFKLVVQDSSRVLVRVADTVRIFRIEGEIMALDELRDNLSDCEAFK